MKTCLPFLLRRRLLSPRALLCKPPTEVAEASVGKEGAPWAQSDNKSHFKLLTLPSRSELLARFFLFAFFTFSLPTPISLSLSFCGIPNHDEPIKYVDLFKHSLVTSTEPRLKQSSVWLLLNASVAGFSLQVICASEN